MFKLFRKSKTTQPVMEHANGSEATLVAKTAAPTRKTKREYEPYQAEFSGLSHFGGMPGMGGHMFVPPPTPVKTTASSKASLSMVPAQPFARYPRASVVQERLETVQGRSSMETLSPIAAAAEVSPQRSLKKAHKTFFNNTFGNT